MENRPDFSDYLVHFTKSSRPCGWGRSNKANKFAMGSARDRLISILAEKTIKCSQQVWVGKDAVCFTECIWGSLLSHANKYSGYGIGFTKAFLFQQGGNPVFYIRPNLFNNVQNNIAEEVKIFLTPFQPTYSEDPMPNNRRYVDYSHEREWRVPHDVMFAYNDIEFVIVQSLSDLKHPKFSPLVKQIGEQKFIVMDNYKKIEQIWPVHKIDNEKKTIK